MADVSFDELKQLLVENCVLKVDVEEITEDTLLFGPGSIGLDSLDALQMTVAVEQHYGIAITDPQIAKQVFHSLHTLRTWLEQQPTKTA